MSQPCSILGIDIGGQSIKAALYAFKGEDIAASPLWEARYSTEKGIQPHAQQIKSILEQALLQSEEMGLSLYGAGIATPGRFDDKGPIKKGTNPNLGTTVHEMDGVVLHELYAKVLKQNQQLGSLRLEVHNDANAMLAGMIHAIQHAKAGSFSDADGAAIQAADLQGKTIGLLGLGTGLGHAIAAFPAQSDHYHFVTDGHASKLRIPVDAGDIAHYLKAGETLARQTGRTEIIAFDDGSVRAEDLCRSPMVNALADVECGTHIDIETSHRHLKAIELAGKYLGRIIAAIAARQIADVEPENCWSEAEIAEAAKTSLYLLGGGLGVSPLGKELMQYAKAELQRQGMTGIRMAQIDAGNVASYAAALMVVHAMEEEAAS